MRNLKTQTERLDYLLSKFKEESVRYADWENGSTYDEKRMQLRALMNVRMPKKLPEDVIAVQDAFLSEEAKNKGTVAPKDIKTVREQYNSGHPFADKISIWQGDITRLSADAIVNAANSQMLGCFVPCHGCIDNAIHSAAGVQLREECARLMRDRRERFGELYEEPVGGAMLTKAYNLPARYVIHTVGPIVRGKLTDKHRKALKSCYRSVLECCAENGIKSVALCCISTGEFHFPNYDAAQIAVEEVTAFLGEKGGCIERVIFNVFKDADREYYEEFFKL